MSEKNILFYDSTTGVEVTTIEASKASPVKPETIVVMESNYEGGK